MERVHCGYFGMPVAAFLLPILGACEQPDPMQATASTILPSSTATHVPTIGHHHDPFTALIDAIPGFGGLYLDGENIVVVLTASADEEHARSVVSGYKSKSRNWLEMAASFEV
jgi:hypothetical protein